MSASIIPLILGLIAAEPATVRINLDTRPMHAISPGIYGASGVSPELAAKYGLTTIRWGGNRSSRYNWKTEADNAGSDWFFLNGKAGSWQGFVDGTQRAGISTYLTVPMLPWVAKGAEGWSFSVKKYGPQQKAESYVPDRGNGVKPNGTPIVDNNPLDASVESTPEFQAEGIAKLKYPNQALPRIYGLDNEPMLWNHTHRDVHRIPPGYDEVFTRGRDYALAIKGVDPGALIAGPCSWGWTDLTFSALDAATDNYATHADNRAHGSVPFLAWYLSEMRKASAKAEKRLLDLVDVHFYPQGQVDGQMVYGGKNTSDALRALRLRSTRGLWDRTYRDESWIRDPVQLIPRVKDWINGVYPGTKLCIGEYNWGGDDDISGAIAQADVLGIFAREKVDYAYLWAGLAGTQRFAFELYRNPDGKHNGFGTTYLDAHSSDPERVTAYAARRADRAVTIVLINKDLKTTAEVEISARTTAGDLFVLPNPPGPVRAEKWQTAERDLKLKLQPLTATMVVFPYVDSRR